LFSILAVDGMNIVPCVVAENAVAVGDINPRGSNRNLFNRNPQPLGHFHPATEAVLVAVIPLSRLIPVAAVGSSAHSGVSRRVALLVAVEVDITARDKNENRNSLKNSEGGSMRLS
jgi:hypothetical protein